MYKHNFIISDFASSERKLNDFLRIKLKTISIEENHYLDIRITSYFPGLAICEKDYINNDFCKKIYESGGNLEEIKMGFFII